MNVQQSSTQIKEKKSVLNQTRIKLKEEFVGLDDVIEQIIKLITPWYLFPELQKRPVVVNLWGMTGVGKTSLVKRLVELIHFNERFYLFDMGNNSNGFDTLKTFFKSLLERENSFPFIIGLDEFQYANTKGRDGSELEKTYSRVVWDLLDTGKFQAFRNTVGKPELSSALSELKFVLSKGVKVDKGIVVDKVDYYLSVVGPSNRWRGNIDEDLEIVSEQDGATVKRKISKRLQFVKDDVIEEIYELCTDRFNHKIEVKDLLLQMNGEETIAFLQWTVRHSQSRKTLDCSKALVFIMGNLDEAYSFSGIVNPDISADEFYTRSKSITINHIKSALQKRFRNEQIARLGNNHIIYPALSKKSYETIIKKELIKFSTQAKETFGFELVFHKSVHKLIYNEGVYPTQGTRPLYSTLQNLIEPYFVLMPATVSENEFVCSRVEVSYEGSFLWILFYDENGIHIHTELEELQLQLEEVRSSKSDELQAVTAVHESGHAIASALLMGIIPTQIFSVTSDLSASGMVLTENKERMVWSKNCILQKAAVCLAGLAAEKLVFGEEHTTAGSDSDIRMATQLISNLVKKQGLTGNNFRIDVEEPFTGPVVYDTDNEFNEQVKELLTASAVMAEDILKRNYKLLIGISKYLSRHSYMSTSKFMQYLNKYTIHKEVTSLIPKTFSYKEALFKAEVVNPLTIKNSVLPSLICLNKSANSQTSK